MKFRRHKDIFIGFPRHATELRVITPAGEVCITWQDIPKEEDRPSLLVSLDVHSPDKGETFIASVARSDRQSILLWGKRPFRWPTVKK